MGPRNNMRKVTYFSGGLVADFLLTEQTFNKFLDDLADAEGEIERYGEKDLMKARALLDNFMLSARDDENIEQGVGEMLGACYIWNFFNTNPDKTRVIEGDIMIIDLVGDLNTVKYASANDVKLGHDH